MDIENQVKFFNIFKETAENNIGLIQGFKRWTDKMYFTIEGTDLLIHVPAVLIKYGSYQRISKSKRKKEIDTLMGGENYTFLEFLIKNSCIIYASTIEKQVAKIGGFYKKGTGK